MAIHGNPGGFVTTAAPTVTTSSAQGIWTLEKQLVYLAAGTWPVLPSNTVAPVVSGSAVEGSTLSCTTGTWTGAVSYTYQWQHTTTNIGGATLSTYVISGSYVGETIRCIVTAINPAGSATANSNDTAIVTAVVSKLWTWGRNTTNGQLALGDKISRSSPSQVGALTNWKTRSRSTTSFFSIFVKTNGTLWAAGQNNAGMLGLGDTIARSSPAQVGALTSWLVAAAGKYHTLAVKSDNSLWAWGYASNWGQLGLNNKINYSSPIQVGSLTNWLNVACGRYSSIAVKTDGTMWGWGDNSFGQGGSSNVINYSSPKQVGALTTWASITSLYATSIATKSNGTIWAWGQGTTGQTAQGSSSNNSSPKQIGALTNWSTADGGFTHCAAVKTDGTLWTWGYGYYGQLGLNSNVIKYSPNQVGSLTNWLKVSAGYAHTVGYKSDGTLWSWGINVDGQLGLGNTTNYSSPKQIGALTTWLGVVCNYYDTSATSS